MDTPSAAKSRYRRVLVKLSGEALAGDKGFGIDLKVIEPMTGVWKTAEEWEQFFCAHSIQAGPICRPPAAA